MTAPSRLSPAAVAVVVYLSIRLAGVVVLAWFGAIHDESLRTLLSRWDGEWMLAIAEHGYHHVPVDNTDARGIHTDTTAFAFFPGYPLLVGLIAKLPLVTPLAAGLLVNLAAGSAAAVAVARVGEFCATRFRGARISPAAARSTGLLLVVFFAAAPMGVVLSMTYTEALFCALAAWALVGVLEGRWIVAGVSAFAVGLVRPTGIAVVLVVMAAAAFTPHGGWRAWFAGIVAPLGYIGYLVAVWIETGSPSGWFKIQTDGWDTAFDGGRATAEFLYDSFTGADDAVSVITSLLIVASLVLLAWSFADRLPWPVLVYGSAVVASTLLSSGLMPSRPRLLLPAFVILIPVAVRLARTSRPVAIGAAVAATLASAWFGAYMLTVFEYAI